MNHHQLRRGRVLHAASHDGPSAGLPADAAAMHAAKQSSPQAGPCSGVSTAAFAGMNCKEICSFLCDYVDGTLAGPSKIAFDAHVAACSHCKDYLSTYAETIRLSKRCCCPKLQPPPPLPEEMIRAIVAAAAKGGGCGGR